MKKSSPKSSFNSLVQLLIPILTIFTHTANATKFPDWGIFLNLLAQPFWIYSSYQAYRKAGQPGMFFTAILVTIINIVGLINYWII